LATSEDPRWPPPRTSTWPLTEGAYAQFAERVEAANLEAERRITEQWVAAMPGDWRAARDFLERRFPTRWRRPETRVERGTEHGGYRPPDDYLGEERRIEALCVALEEWTAQHRASEDEAFVLKARERGRA
jgi:hypothetical protein